MSNNKRALKGGEFLIKDVDYTQIFIPEEFTEEQKMIADSCRDFIQQRVLPNVEELDKHNLDLLIQLMKEAGEMGLLGIAVPEEYGGFGQNFVTAMRALEEIGKGFSFAVAYAAHTGIGTLPILYFGNKEQKEKYLPKLATGEYFGAYALTEPEAGSDANAGKTKAVLSEDGKYYILNGTKMWITNAGIADVFIVYAKIDDDPNLSAFIVEKNTPGLKLGPEEEKMGIRGASTRQIFFEDAKVPVENLLGERNKGFKIALYILNLGRIKLAGATIGAAKAAINYSVDYAKQRKQFGTYIANFGAIKHKLAEMVIRTFVTESLTYRASQNIEDEEEALKQEGMDKDRAAIEAIRQFAIEASIAKVFGSEALDYIVDEAVQIHGGMGYSAEMPVERAYRDSRINRIFEGTNEINRLVIVGELLKRGLKGEYDLLTPAKEVAKELMAIPDFGTGSEDYFEKKHKLVKNFKKAILMVAGAALQKFGQAFQDEEEVIMNIADMLMLTYATESTLLRVEKLSKIYDPEKLAIYKDILDVFSFDTAWKMYKIGVDTVNAFAKGDEQQAMLMGMKRFTKVDPVNTKDARRRIADKLIEDGYYNF